MHMVVVNSTAHEHVHNMQAQLTGTHEPPTQKTPCSAQQPCTACCEKGFEMEKIIHGKKQ